MNFCFGACRNRDIFLYEEMHVNSRRRGIFISEREVSMIFIIHEGLSRTLFPLTGSQTGKAFYKLGERKSLFEEQICLGRLLVPPENMIAVTGSGNHDTALKQMRNSGAEGASAVEDGSALGSLLMMIRLYAYCRDMLHADSEEVLIFSAADYDVFPKEQGASFLKEAADRVSEGSVIGIRYRQRSARRGSPSQPAVNRYPHMIVGAMKTLQGDIEAAGDVYASLLQMSYYEIVQKTAEMEAGGDSGKEAFLCPSMILAEPSDIYADEVSTLEDFYEWMKKDLSDGQGNVISGPVAADGCSDCLILGGRRPVAVKGLHNYIIADTPGALVILPSGSSQEGETMTVPYRNAENEIEGISMPEEWGSCCVLKIGNGWVVKCLVIAPGKEVPRHMHGHMRECINVMSGEGTACLDGVQRVLRKNQCSLVPTGAWHSLVNTGSCDWVVISTMTV